MLSQSLTQPLGTAVTNFPESDFARFSRYLAMPQSDRENSPLHKQLLGATDPEVQRGMVVLRAIQTIKSGKAGISELSDALSVLASTEKPVERKNCFEMIAGMLLQGDAALMDACWKIKDVEWAKELQVAIAAVGEQGKPKNEVDNTLFAFRSASTAGNISTEFVAELLKEFHKECRSPLVAQALPHLKIATSPHVMMFLCQVLTHPLTQEPVRALASRVLSERMTDVPSQVAGITELKQLIQVPPGKVPALVAPKIFGPKVGFFTRIQFHASFLIKEKGSLLLPLDHVRLAAASAIAKFDPDARQFLREVQGTHSARKVIATSSEVRVIVQRDFPWTEGIGLIPRKA